MQTQEETALFASELCPLKRQKAAPTRLLFQIALKKPFVNILARKDSILFSPKKELFFRSSRGHFRFLFLVVVAGKKQCVYVSIKVKQRLQQRRRILSS